MKSIILLSVSFLLLSCNQQTEYFYPDNIERNGSIMTMYGEPAEGIFVYEDENSPLRDNDDVISYLVEFDKGLLVSKTSLYTDSKIDSIIVEGRKVGIYSEPKSIIDYSESKKIDYYKSGKVLREGKIKKVKTIFLDGVWYDCRENEIKESGICNDVSMSNRVTEYNKIEYVGDVTEYSKDGEPISVSNYSDESVQVKYFLEDSVTNQIKDTMFDIGLSLSDEFKGYLLRPTMLQEEFSFYGLDFRVPKEHRGQNVSIVDEFTISLPTGVIRLSGNPNNENVMLTGYPTMEYNTKNMGDVEQRIKNSISTIRMTINPDGIEWE